MCEKFLVVFTYGCVIISLVLMILCTLYSELIILSIIIEIILGLTAFCFWVVSCLQERNELKNEMSKKTD